jgi:speckle-type POZ protein
LFRHTFSIGGYEWSICYYHDGCRKEDGEEYISIFIDLMNKGCEVRFLSDLRLVEEASARSFSMVSQETPTIFKAGTTHDS